MQRVFLSYAHADAVVAGRLETDLEANGIAVWRDVKAILPGDSITRSIEGALRNCTAIVLALSPQSARSAWVEREYRAALHLQTGSSDDRPRILPCLLGACDIPVFLSDIAYADLRRYEVGFTQLAGALGVTKVLMPSVSFREDVVSLIARVEEAVQALRRDKYPSPSHKLFDEWSSLEDELTKLVTVEYSLLHQKKLERSRWELENWRDADGRPTLDCEPYPRNLFVLALAEVVQASLQLAERYGRSSNLPSGREDLFRMLGGTPASN